MALFAATNASAAQSLRSDIAGLKMGGYVIVMRHANSPAAPPDKASADAENTTLERQLDEAGKATSQAMGAAFRTLGIPVGVVLSSPTYRARQTVRHASFGEPEIRQELAEGAQNMQSAASAGPSAWLRAQAAVVPRAGTNIIIVTHSPNILGAFGQQGANVASGESLIFRPDANGNASLVARVKIDEWKTMAGTPGQL
jgi:phosphohistidine phosphatase SixA